MSDASAIEFFTNNQGSLLKFLTIKFFDEIITYHPSALQDENVLLNLRKYYILYIWSSCLANDFGPYIASLNRYGSILQRKNIDKLGQTLYDSKEKIDPLTCVIFLRMLSRTIRQVATCLKDKNSISLADINSCFTEVVQSTIGSISSNIADDE